MTDKEALENFLYDIECLNKLDKWSKEINIFDILKIKNTEIRHSNILSWLMDPNEKHGLRDKFIQKMLKKIIRDNSTNSPVSIFDLDNFDFDDLVVSRENHNIDILAMSKKSSFVLCIENKVKSGEHDNQLQKYFDFVNSAYTSYEKKMFIYLTLHGEDSSDVNNWLSFSYEEIYYILMEMVEFDEIDSKAKFYLNDYISVLGEEFMENDELKEICSNIYYKHKRAIDLLIENIPDIYSKRYDAIVDLINNYSDDKVILVTSSKSLIRFVSPKLRGFVGQIGDDSWVKEKDLLVFEYRNSRNSPATISLYIGPGNQEDRAKYLEKAKSVNLSSKMTKKLKDKWNAIYVKEIAPANYELPSLDDDIDHYVSKIKKFIETEMDSIVEKLIQS